MNVEKVRERLKHIYQLQLQYESEEATRQEMLLHVAVLQSIAQNTCENPHECANEALKSQEIIFQRNIH